MYIGLRKKFIPISDNVERIPLQSAMAGLDIILSLQAFHHEYWSECPPMRFSNIKRLSHWFFLQYLVHYCFNSTVLLCFASLRLASFSFAFLLRFTFVSFRYVDKICCFASKGNKRNKPSVSLRSEKNLSSVSLQAKTYGAPQ
jgi:hypothetical protein